MNKLNDTQLKEYKNIFHIFDIDDNGYIDFNEFYTVLKKLGISRAEYEIREMFDEIDKNKNNLIEYEEIINYLNETISYNDINNIIDAFYTIDIEKKKYININDLFRYIKLSGINIDKYKLVSDFEIEDFNNDRKITLNEFIMMIERNEKITNIKLLSDLLVFINKLETKNLIDTKCVEQTYMKYNFLKTLNCFTKVYRSRLLRLCNETCINEYPFGEIICTEKMDFSHFYIVNTGLLDIYIKNKNNYQKIATRGKGFIIGICEYYNDLKKYKYYVRSYCNNMIIYKVPITIIKWLINIDKVFAFRLKETYNKFYISLFEKKIYNLEKIKKIDYKLPPLKNNYLLKRNTKNYSKLGKALDRILFNY